jgi:hypothetical protein
VSSNATSIATATISGKTITIKSVNSTTGTAVITVSVPAGGNYKATSATITVNAAFWSWEDNDDTVGDASWWATLKTKVASMTTDERKACVGKTKRVSLSASVLGITAGESVAMRCIGYDLDGTGTLAF